MNDVRKMGRVTIPTDTDAVSETLDLLKRWGADATAMALSSRRS
jgi:1,3-beta-galactosyl-N-acetylhexosamine phosphorylase